MSHLDLMLRHGMHTLNASAGDLHEGTHSAGLLCSLDDIESSHYILGLQQQTNLLSQDRI